MRLEKILAGKYRAEYIGRFFWVIREGRKWMWYPGGYHGYAPWEKGYGPFTSKREATKDIIRSFLT